LAARRAASKTLATLVRSMVRGSTVGTYSCGATGGRSPPIQGRSSRRTAPSVPPPRRWTKSTIVVVGRSLRAPLGRVSANDRVGPREVRSPDLARLGPRTQYGAGRSRSRHGGALHGYLTPGAMTSAYRPENPDFDGLEGPRVTGEAVEIIELVVRIVDRGASLPASGSTSTPRWRRTSEFEAAPHAAPRMTIFPRAWPDSMRTCASAICSNEKT